MNISQNFPAQCDENEENSMKRDVGQSEKVLRRKFSEALGENVRVALDKGSWKTVACLTTIAENFA